MQVSGRGDSSLQKVLEVGMRFGFFVYLVLLFLLIFVLNSVFIFADDSNISDINSTNVLANDSSFVQDVAPGVSFSALPAPAPTYPPISIENLTLSPDPFKVYNSNQWVNYSDVFNRNMTCSFTINGPTEAGTTLMVETNIIFQNDAIGKFDRPVLPSGFQYKEYKNGEKGNVTIDSKYIFPNDNITCNVTVNDLKGRVVSNLSNNVTMPTFDLFIKKIEILNAVEGVNLIRGKESAVRVWPSFESNLINVSDVPINVSYELRYKRSSVIIDSGSMKSEVRKYPDIEVMKSNLETEVFPGLKAKEALKDFVKKAKDSVNFRTKQLTDFNSVDIYADLNRDKMVKDNNITPNTLSKVKVMDDQKKDLKIIVIIAGNNITLDKFQKDLITDIVKSNMDIVTTITPLTKENTKVINMDDLFKYTVPIKNLPVLNWGATNPDGVTPLDKDAYHGGEFAYNFYLVGPADDIRIKEKADIAWIFVMEPNYFRNSEVLGVAPRNFFANAPAPSYVLMNYKVNAGLFIADYHGVLAHELGHLIGDMEEQYVRDSGIIGIPTKEHGWDFRGIGQSDLGKPIINIWTNNFKKDYTGNIMKEDVPEDRVPFEPSMGYTRYFNIMGNANRVEWIDKESFNKFLTKLEDKGFFSKTI